MSRQREIFISVDVEAAGPVPPDYSLLSVGACAVDDVSGDAFYRELRPISDRFDPAALKVTGFDLDDLARNGCDPTEAMADFANWIARVAGADGEPVFVGFNAPFDWSFVNYYFHHFHGQNPFGIAALDIKSLYMGAAGCSWGDTRSSRFPIPRQESPDQTQCLGGRSLPGRAVQVRAQSKNQPIGRREALANSGVGKRPPDSDLRRAAATWTESSVDRGQLHLDPRRGARHDAWAPRAGSGNGTDANLRCRHIGPGSRWGRWGPIATASL